jgi:hypothetical protein
LTDKYSGFVAAFPTEAASDNTITANQDPLARRLRHEADARAAIASQRVGWEARMTEQRIESERRWVGFRERELAEYVEKRRVDLEVFEARKRDQLARELEKRLSWRSD